MERDSFIFYKSYFEAIQEFDEKKQLKLFNSISKYALYGEIPVGLKGIEKAVFSLIEPQLKANNKRYENGCKGGEHGIKGGAPIGNQNAKKTTPKQPQNNPKTTPNENENENENENVVDERVRARRVHARDDTTTKFLKKYFSSNLPPYGGLSKKQREQLESICEEYSCEQLMSVIDYCKDNKRFLANLPYIINNIQTLVAESETFEENRRNNEEAARAEQDKKNMRDFIEQRATEIKRELFEVYAKKFGTDKWTSEQFAEYEDECNKKILELIKQLKHQKFTA